MTTNETPAPAQQLDEVLALVASYDLLTPQPFMFDEGLGGDSEWCICDSKSNLTGAEMGKQDAIAFSAAVNWLRQHGRRALAALEAVDGAIKVEVADNAWIGCVPQHLAGTPVLIIPADAVEVSRGE